MFKNSKLSNEQRLVMYNLIAYAQKAAGLIAIVIGANLLMNGSELSGQCDFAEQLMSADQDKGPDAPAK